MATGMIDIIKRASLDAYENMNPTDVREGVVVSANPLKVKISNNLTLPASVLVVPQHLKTYSATMKIDDENKSVTVYNSLNVSDKVALLRRQGGQSYYILDRI